MNKLAEDFALKAAQDLSEMFPNLLVRYEYHKFLRTHWIQFFDEEVFKTPAFTSFYIKTVDTFDAMFQAEGEELGFLTDNILIKLENPLYISHIPAKVSKQSTQKISYTQTIATANAGERTYAMAA